MPIPPDFTVHGEPPAGLAAIIADAVCGAAVVSAGAARPAVTISLHLDIRQPLPVSGHLRGQARLPFPLHPGPQLVAGTVVDDAGTVIAHCSSWWFPGRTMGDPPRLWDIDDPELPPLISADTVESRFGAQATAVDGRARLTAYDTAAYVNRRGVLHGGVATVLAELAADRALESLGIIGGRTLGLSVDFLAPTGLQGAAVQVESEVVRAGRQICVIHSTVLAPSGAPAAVARFTRCM